MQLEEGQLYEGTISISGGDGPFRRWIVVSPFGKTHIHSIDEPLEMRCWPVALVERGVGSGRLRYVGMEPDHPAIRVQRIKEKIGVRDAHLSLSKHSFDRLVDALRDAVENDEAVAPYLAGEIFCSAAHSALAASHREEIVERVHDLLGIGYDGGLEPGLSLGSGYNGLPAAT